ncbi:MAG TPA: sugar ABC transporter permease [Chloroflexota bacterium]|nr:sugar ABC transporter permease [Chloroflexota bacterium]
MNMAVSSMRPRAARRLRWGRLTPYWFVLPWVVGLAVFTLGPLLFSLVISFFDWPIIGAHHFIGFDNYSTMFTNDPLFWQALGVTFKFAAIFVPLNLVSALLLAMLLSRPARGLSIYRTLFYLPAVVSGVALALVWGWVFDGQYGLLNYLLSLVGISGPDWLNDPHWTLLAMVIASLWSQGAAMLIFLAALKNISVELYEAAGIDGAGRLMTFLRITIPMISPTILFNLITSIIAAFQTLTLALVMTNGGPVRATYFYALYVYQNAFQGFQMGYASANAWIMFLIIIALTLIVFKSSPRWVYYEGDVRGN